MDHRALRLDDAEAAQALIEDLRDAVRRGCGATCILQNLAPPPEPLYGSLDPAVAGSRRAVLEAVNAGLAAMAAGSDDHLLDVAGLASAVGLERWHDPVQWHLGKLPFSQALVPLYAEALGRLLGALRGKSRKCLVLDLDNTLWHGVIGDDGLEGIEIGQGSPLGEAHLAVQQTALDLRARGVVLAVCSKNDEATALEPFRKHPDMLLREEHIAVFQANWEDKASNLKAIAEALSLGTEALVLMDDNPAERALVRSLLPEVAVPELPEDPALFPRTLLAAGYFETVAFSDEDRARAAYYETNAKRASLKERVGDLDDYLRSLDMTASMTPFDALGRKRIAQLVNKTNQFNLTTRRYSEAEIEAFERDPDCLTLQVRLADSFGDNGMISVVICRRVGDDWEIDTWLMSCRVMGRRLEEAVLDELVRQAQAAGIDHLRGLYRPSARNGMVAEHYDRLGFETLSEEPDGSRRYGLPLAAANLRNPPIAVVR